MAQLQFHPVLISISTVPSVHFDFKLTITLFHGFSSTEILNLINRLHRFMRFHSLIIKMSKNFKRASDYGI